MNYGLEIELLTADKNRFKDAAERARKDADDNHLAWCKAKEAHETLILALRETDRLLACEPQAWTQAKTDQMRRNQELIHGIPHDKGEQRCQAVGGDAEGKVPTTAPDYAQKAAPGNRAGSGDATLSAPCAGCSRSIPNRRRHAENTGTYVSLAREAGVSHGAVYCAIQRRTWRHL